MVLIGETTCVPCLPFQGSPIDTCYTANILADTHDVDGDRYRLAQAAELQIRFRDVEGRAANDRTELTASVSRSDIERPVVPRPSLLAPHLD